MEIEVFENLKNCLTRRSITLRGVQLGAVSHCRESDLAQYCTARSLTPRSVRQFWIFGHFNFLTRQSVILRRVGLGPVWYCAKSDSVQYNTARSHIFREYLRENEFFSETILNCLSGTQMGWIYEKKLLKNSWNCLFKSNIEMLIFFFINIDQTNWATTGLTELRR